MRLRGGIQNQRQVLTWRAGGFCGEGMYVHEAVCATERHADEQRALSECLASPRYSLDPLDLFARFKLRHLVATTVNSIQTCMRPWRRHIL